MIDSHIHVVSPNLPGAGALAGVLRAPPEIVAAAIRRELKEAGASLALAMGEWNTPPDDPLGVASTLQIAHLVPEIRAIGVADPAKGDDPEHLRRVEAALKQMAGRVVALKCYLGYLHYEPGHKNYRRYYELAAHFKIPVIFHTGDTYSPYAKLKFAHPLGVDEVAVDHPKTRFVLAHVGNPWTVDAAEVIYKNLNVWADLSGIIVGDGTEFDKEEYADGIADAADRIRKAFRYCERPNRFVFGTDWPLIPIAVYRDWIADVIPSAHHEQVFEENARLLFRL